MHICLEEYIPASEDGARGDSIGAESLELVVVSAKSKISLEQNLRRLAAYMKNYFPSSASVTLGQVAYTLAVGREAHDLRVAVVAQTHQDCAMQLLTAADDIKEASTVPKSSKSPSVVFVFPGQGSQYLNMGKGVYIASRTFRTYMDTCADLISPLLGHDLLKSIFVHTVTADAESAFSCPTIIQPALFAVEYSMAMLLMDLGIKPAAVAGHSIGEYVAATISGVISLKDAIQLIVMRANETLAAPEGSMLAINMSYEAVEVFVKEFNASSGVPRLWIAAVNSPADVVISGSVEAIQSAETSLKARDQPIKCARVHVNRPFHSALMKSAAEKLRDFCGTVTLQSPNIPMTSNVTGQWLTDEASLRRYLGNYLA